MGTVTIYRRGLLAQGQRRRGGPDENGRPRALPGQGERQERDGSPRRRTADCSRPHATAVLRRQQPLAEPEHDERDRRAASPECTPRARPPGAPRACARPRDHAPIAQLLLAAHRRGPPAQLAGRARQPPLGHAQREARGDGEHAGDVHRQRVAPEPDGRRECPPGRRSRGSVSKRPPNHSRSYARRTPTAVSGSRLSDTVAAP